MKKVYGDYQMYMKDIIEGEVINPEIVDDPWLTEK